MTQNFDEEILRNFDYWDGESAGRRQLGVSGTASEQCPVSGLTLVLPHWKVRVLVSQCQLPVAGQYHAVPSWAYEISFNFWQKMVASCSAGNWATLP
jgi:hypothetical protein